MLLQVIKIHFPMIMEAGEKILNQELRLNSQPITLLLLHSARETVNFILNVLDGIYVKNALIDLRVR